MNVITIIAIILVILVLGIGIFYFYSYLPRISNVNKYKIPLLVDETEFNEKYSNSLQVANSVSNRKTLYVPKMGYGLSFSWEMYIPNLPGNDKWQNSFNILKPIISINDSPQISYHPKKNYLSIILKYRDNPFYAQFNEIKFENIKLQKWSKYILIINGRNVVLYIDGNLAVSKYLPSLPVIYDINSEVVLGQKNNNFQGKIRNLYMYPYPLSYTEIINL